MLKQWAHREINNDALIGRCQLADEPQREVAPEAVVGQIDDPGEEVDGGIVLGKVRQLVGLKEAQSAESLCSGQVPCSSAQSFFGYPPTCALWVSCVFGTPTCALWVLTDVFWVPTYLWSGPTVILR